MRREGRSPVVGGCGRRCGIVRVRSGFDGARGRRRAVGRRDVIGRARKKPEGGGPEAIQRILGLVEGTQQGQNLGAGARKEIEEACNSIASTSSPVEVNDELSKSWKLVFTTEKETLFICSSAKKLLGLDTEVRQVIDLERKRLQNRIEFSNGASFVVDSSLSTDAKNDRRANFEFTGAKLALPSSVFNLPPVGKGWFDNLYIDETYRLAVDSRNDILLVQNVGEPDFFD